MSDALFLEASSREILPGCPVILGCPLDETATYRAGSDKAPQAIRLGSESIETYSPLLDRDLSDHDFFDLGDLHFEPEALEKSLEIIELSVTEILKSEAFPICLGGEHTITLPIVKALKALHSDFIIVHLDAHTDLRDHYEGNRVNHATVMRRVREIVGPGRLLQLGIRSGTREEFSWMREQGTLLEWNPSLDKALLERVRDMPVYLTLDLDVLDPACLPGTGNPEAGGWFYNDLERIFLALDQVTLLGADVVELNPGLDSSGVSAITASKIVREILLITGRDR